MQRRDQAGEQRQVVTGRAAANKQERNEQLNKFLLRRPSAAEVVDKGIIPRSVIDEGKASWQVGMIPEYSSLIAVPPSPNSELYFLCLKLCLKLLLT
jgi:hypothetical protein